MARLQPQYFHASGSIFHSPSNKTTLVPTGEYRYACEGEWATYPGTKDAWLATFDHGTPGKEKTEWAIILEEKPMPMQIDHTHPDLIIKNHMLNAIVGDARLAAERSINPRFRKAYEDLEAAASHCFLLQEEDRRCCQ